MENPALNQSGKRILLIVPSWVLRALLMLNLELEGHRVISYGCYALAYRAVPTFRDGYQPDSILIDLAPGYLPRLDEKAGRKAARVVIEQFHRDSAFKQTQLLALVEANDAVPDWCCGIRKPFEVQHILSLLAREVSVNGRA